ncbi:hypothetical protein VP01_1884g3 [Puccinia sorghi]|uniref:Uncharacterized protein n=1 Tax=Puccinia sorghi TaxID=27349 RepID=A0A0L6VD31_9BASI|nr:hypothetical protein VP01_1884g3 [Puccinia sorghi]
MSYVHCQHTSADTASCRCPVWEAPEDNHDQPAKLCDTCGHRAEWHQVDSAEEGEEENCKSSWPNGQPCTCPTWVPFEDPTKNSGCALCGHKKGWHRPTITRASSTQGTPSKMQPNFTTTPEVLKPQGTDWHSRAQSCGTGKDAGGLRVRTYSANSWAPGSKSGSSTSQFSDSSRTQSILSFTPEGSVISPSSVWSSTARIPAAQSPTDEIQLAAEHMRFILSELDGDEEKDASKPEVSFPDSRSRSRAPSSSASHSSFSATSQSSLFSYEAPLPHLHWKGDGRSPSPSAARRRSVDLNNACSASMSFSSMVEGSHCRTQSQQDYQMRLSELDLSDNNKLPQDAPAKSPLRQPPITIPLMAQTTSETYVEELPFNRPKHPSEERSGRFAAKSTDIASNTPLDDGSPIAKVNPFQANIHSVIHQEIPVLNQHTSKIMGLLKPVALSEKGILNPGRETVEAHRSNDQAFSLSVSPPPSSTVFSPGDYLSVTIQLRNSTTEQETLSPLEFEHQLQRWKRITFELAGVVTQHGNVEHQILSLQQSVHLADHREPDPLKTGWQFKLQIPHHTNCRCGPGHLPLPSSCSNSVGHVNYHLILKGKRKTFLTKASTAAESKLFVCLNLKSHLSATRQKLLTSPQSFRSLSTWISLNAGHKAAINRTLLTYQVEYVTSNILKIFYDVDLDLSADSEGNNHANAGLFGDLSSSLNVTITSVSQLITNTHASVGGEGHDNNNNPGEKKDGAYEANHKACDFRSRPVPIRSEKTGIITWRISGYLQVELQDPSYYLSPSAPTPKKYLLGQLRAYAAAAPSNKSSSSQWILRASIQSVLLSQPINICGALTELQSSCAARSISQGIHSTLK